MASSLRVGVRAVWEQRPLALGALIMVCDQPALSAKHLRYLLTAHRTTPDHVIASQYAGRSGVPVVLPREMVPAILKLTGDQGARVILQQTSRIKNIPFVDGELDLDYPDDLRFWMEAT
jgi:CTP:molybdopterin cytidylyltransferase MocA